MDHSSAGNPTSKSHSFSDRLRINVEEEEERVPELEVVDMYKHGLVDTGGQLHSGYDRICKSCASFSQTKS